MVEREHRIRADGERLQCACLKTCTHGFHAFVGFYAIERQSVDAHIGVHATVEREDVKRNGALQGGNENLRGALGHGFVCSFKVGAAWRVEHDVGAFAVAQLTHTCRHIFCFGIDGVHASSGAFPWACATSHGNHICAGLRSQLHRRLAYFAIGPHHGHGLPALGHAAAAKALIGCDEGHTDRACFFKAQVAGFLTQCSLRQHQPPRVRAVARDAQIATRAPDLFADPSAGAIDHHACKVASRCARKNGLRHDAKRRFDVAGVHPCAAHTDQCIAWLQGRGRLFFNGGCQIRGRGGFGVHAHSA